MDNSAIPKMADRNPKSPPHRLIIRAPKAQLRRAGQRITPRILITDPCPILQPLAYAARRIYKHLLLLHADISLAHLPVGLHVWQVGRRGRKERSGSFHHVLDCGRTDSRLEAHNAHEDAPSDEKAVYCDGGVVVAVGGGMCGCGTYDSEGMLMRV